MSGSRFTVTAERLSQEMAEGDVRIVDASWYMPAQNRNPQAEFEAAHIPGAVFFDQDRIVDAGSALPHTLPPVESFADAAGQLGLTADSKIVVYDGAGLFSAARVWWMLRLFGARDVRVLDGGFPAWRAAGLPVESGDANPEATLFEARFDDKGVVFLDEMRAIVDGGALQIADARSTERFTGAAAEPRAGVRSGHMPGAHSVPFTQLLADGRLKSADELRAVLTAAGIDPDAPVVTSCGSGVTAAVINLALATLGNHDARLYDGSWTEWGSQQDTPVATGEAAQRGAGS